jgi:hypothetical protein
VVRYQLVPGSGRHPLAYLRISAALATKQREIAGGLSLRPIPAIPLSLMTEARLVDDAWGGRIKPVMMVVTELAPISLPADMSAEIYAQGGYAAGQDATPFGDGQVRVTRRVSVNQNVSLDVGGGAWAGGQRGARRVDFGPTVRVSFSRGATRLRLAADWRLRVAGDAAPASGPAMTISAGF